MDTKYDERKQKCCIFSQLEYFKHNFIISVQDTTAESGRYLVKEFISFSKDNDIHIFCYDCDINEMREELNVHEKRVTLYDCLPEFALDSNVGDKLEKFVSSLNDQPHHSNKLIIVIDSLSTLLLQKPYHVVLKLLRQLSRVSINTTSGERVQIQILTVLHEDTLLNSKQILAHLKILCPVRIKVYDRRIDVAVRKRSRGKIISSVFKYEGHVNDRIEWCKESTINASSNGEVNECPLSTFKLTLSESEKKARDAVQLPYERSSVKHESNSQASIIYEPDEYDDWDEEDPDNDLEFS